MLTIQVTFSNGTVQRLHVEKVEYQKHCLGCTREFFALDPFQQYCTIECEQREEAASA